MPAWAYVLAQTVDVTDSALPLWAEAGIAGVIIAAFIAEQIVSGRTHRREVSRADRLEAELQRVNTKVVDDVVPAMERATMFVESARADRRGDRHVDRAAGDR